MNGGKRKPPYLRPVPPPPLRAPVDKRTFEATSWQRTLFATTNTSLLLFVHLDAVSDSEFIDLVESSKPRFILDIRVVPRFDIGSMTRRGAFALFEQTGSRYVDVSGRLGMTDRRDGRLNPGVLASHILELIGAHGGEVEGPVLVLVDAGQFSEEYVAKLSDGFSALRKAGWEVLRVPTFLVRGHGSAETDQTDRDLVFISHANPEDNDFTTWLGVRLSLAGYRVWSDVTRLIGGENFWTSIEQVVREHACKVVVVLSRAAATKGGVLDEIQLALSLERSEKLENFVVPVLIDDLPYQDVQVNLIRKNIINCAGNWASGLEALLKVFARDQVPVRNIEGSVMEDWVVRRAQSKDSLTTETELLSSTWLQIWDMKKDLLFMENVDHLAEQVEALHSLPTVSVGSHIVTFSNDGTVDSDISGQAISVRQGLLDGIKTPTEIGARHFSNVVSDLLRQSWDRFAKSRGLKEYRLSSGRTAWYPPVGLIEGDSVQYRDMAGKARRKYLTGMSKKRGVYWHYALEAKPVLGRIDRYCTYAHIVFSIDGDSQLVSKARMHSLRRQFCKNWWNDRWRDLSIAYLSWLAGGDRFISLPSASNEWLKISAKPMIFRSPVSVLARPDDDKYDGMIEELEWEDLDEGEDDTVEGEDEPEDTDRS